MHDRFVYYLYTPEHLQVLEALQINSRFKNCIFDCSKWNMFRFTSIFCRIGRFCEPVAKSMNWAHTMLCWYETVSSWFIYLKKPLHNSHYEIMWNQCDRMPTYIMFLTRWFLKSASNYMKLTPVKKKTKKNKNKTKHDFPNSYVQS